MSAIEIVEPPVDKKWIEQLVPLWETTFETSYCAFRPVLDGAERTANRNRLYIAHRDGNVVGSCQLTVPVATPQFGGLGEVVVIPESRGQGLAGKMCRLALAEFSASAPNGVLFLGTVNPVAARVYYRLGWRQLAGSTLMANIIDDRSPEEFLVDAFRTKQSATISLLTSVARTSLIPLIVSPHDWHLLDVNTRTYSTRCRTQSSCMGLFPRFDQIQKEGGIVYQAAIESGLVVGLATARPIDAGSAQIDAFAHGNYADACGALWDTIEAWAADQNLRPIARVARDDQAKQTWLVERGFTPSSSIGDEILMRH